MRQYEVGRLIDVRETRKRPWMIGGGEIVALTTDQFGEQYFLIRDEHGRAGYFKREDLEEL